VEAEKLFKFANSCAEMNQKEVVVSSSVGTMSKVDLSRCKVLPEPFLTNQIVLFFRKNHFLVDSVDKTIGIFKSVGLNDYWISQYGKRKKIVFADNGPKILTIGKLSGIFYILIFGLILGVFTFIFEIFLHRFIYKRKSAFNCSAHEIF
jgi:hypothetical protein